MINLNQYRSTSPTKLGYPRASQFHGIPMQFYNEVRAYFRMSKIPCRYQFRGPRVNDSRQYRTFPSGEPYSIIPTYLRGLRQHNCLKETATHFAVYFR